MTDYSKPFREIKSDFTIGTSQSSRKQTNAESLSHQLELKTMISEQRLKNAGKSALETQMGLPLMRVMNEVSSKIATEFSGTLSIVKLLSSVNTVIPNYHEIEVL